MCLSLEAIKKGPWVKIKKIKHSGWLSLEHTHAFSLDSKGPSSACFLNIGSPEGSLLPVTS